jgi:hypothetical protein
MSCPGLVMRINGRIGPGHLGPARRPWRLSLSEGQASRTAPQQPHIGLRIRANSKGLRALQSMGVTAMGMTARLLAHGG